MSAPYDWLAERDYPPTASLPRSDMKLLGPLLTAIGEDGPLDAAAASAALDRLSLLGDPDPEVKRALTYLVARGLIRLEYGGHYRLRHNGLAAEQPPRDDTGRTALLDV